MALSLALLLKDLALIGGVFFLFWQVAMLTKNSVLNMHVYIRTLRVSVVRLTRTK